MAVKRVEGVIRALLAAPLVVVALALTAPWLALLAIGWAVRSWQLRRRRQARAGYVNGGPT